MKRMFGKGLLALALKGAGVVTVAAAVSAIAMSAQAATMTEGLVENYASAMKTAANSQDINRVANLVSDEALISLSRRGKSTSLDKDGYLNLLQSSWNQTSNYQYDIQVEDVVTSGTQAKANVRTVESWVKDGKQVTFVTSSRVTLTVSTGNAVLLRAVSQVTIN
ncbi:hypothetical protein [Psychrobacter aestuarii]|uniref:Aspartate aminotransferase n=1 Tax=Psychrobacter aestuarii TaxID=556327 RepID=A0ABP3FM78_9GAMM|nr:hypothetical protein [Psychrobacter aestuarii]